MTTGKLPTPRTEDELRQQLRALRGKRQRGPKLVESAEGRELSTWLYQAKYLTLTPGGLDDLTDVQYVSLTEYLPLARDLLARVEVEFDAVQKSRDSAAS